MTDAQRNVRMNIRNFLMVASRSDMLTELQVSVESGDTFRAECIREMIKEDAR